MSCFNLKNTNIMSYSFGWTSGLTSTSSPSSCYWRYSHPVESIKGFFQIRNTQLTGTVLGIVGHSGSPCCIYFLCFFLYSLTGDVVIRKSRNCVIVEKAESEEHIESVWVQEEKQKSCCFNWGNLIKEICYMSIVKLGEWKNGKWSNREISTHC